MGYGVALVIHFASPKSVVGAALLNMAVFGAVIAYVMQMISYLRLRRRFPSMKRPYISPVGRLGAMIAMVLSLMTLGALFFNADYRPAVVGALLWFVIGIVYFASYARHHLVRAPEESFAMDESAADHECV